jgi:hypothetical protein
MRYLKLYEDFRLYLESAQPAKHTLCSFPGIEPDTKKPPFLIIPGGGGNPVSDFTQLGPLLSEKYDVVTFYYNENVSSNGKNVCKKIADEIKEKYPKDWKTLPILGFSMGTTFGFWIISSLGPEYNGKFICIDAAAPNAATPKQYISSTMKNNTMRRFHCLTLSSYQKELKDERLAPEGQEPTQDQMISFKYKYKTEVFEKNPKEFDFSNAKLTDFDLDESEYEKWRNSKNVVVEFLDEPFKSGKGKHYPSEMNTSNIWVNGKKIEVPEVNIDIDINEYFKLIMKLTDEKDTDNIWIVQDKNDSNSNKNFYCDIYKGDRYNAIKFLTKQAEGMVGSLQRNPDKPEKIDVDCLVIRAGKTDAGSLTKKEAENDPNLPSDNTKVEIIEGVEHGNICQHGADKIFNLVNNFVK